jgi:hypothetical protein
MKRQAFLLRSAGFVVGLYLAPAATASSPPLGFVLPRGTYWYAVAGEVPQLVKSNGGLRLTPPAGASAWIARLPEPT